MELIRIGEGKLKVMLTAEDMVYYALDAANDDGEAAGARRAVWDILDTAEAQLGFTAARDRISIQMFKGRSGGCELFVSCTGDVPTAHRRLYAFDSASCLATACRVLAVQGFVGTAVAFRGEDRRLFLQVEMQTPKTTPSLLDVLAEYGTALRDGYLSSEHMTLLTTDAVATLAPLALTPPSACAAVKSV